MAKRIDFKEHILLETKDYIFWNKPSMLASLKERGDASAENALDLAKKYAGNAILCHRIDKQTSGILLIAKNQESHRHASMQFQKKTVVKKYLAFAQGQTHFDDFLVDLPIHIDEKRRTVRIDKQNGKLSTTYFTTLVNYNNHSLIECNIKTGRMHQIRIHLSAIGHPIIADELYGGKPILLSELKRKYQLNKTGEEKPIIERFALHAAYICIENMEGESIEVHAAFPKDLAVLKKQLDKFCNMD